MSKTRKKRTTNNKTRKQHKKNTLKRVFKKDDYYSGDGFLTSTWGPPLWHALHTMSFNYPVDPSLEDKHHYRDFILSLQNEKGCTEPLYGEKSKCILKIVPQADKGETMQIDKKCIKRRSSTFSAALIKVEPNPPK